MSFKATSKKIDFDALKEESALTGEALARKEARDHELEAIMKGEDDRVLWSSVLAHQITKRLFSNTLIVWQNFKKK